MSHPNSIIVYRNPMEQAFWESGIIFPMICAVIVAIVLALGLFKLYELLPWDVRRTHGVWISNLIICLTIASAIGTIWFMR